MSALTDHIAQQHARGDRLPLLALCPVRGCLSFAPVGRHCSRHYIQELDALIRAAGLRVTFDAERDISKPCIGCGAADKPRDLVTVACRVNKYRDDVSRPLCAECSQGLMS